MGSQWESLPHQFDIPGRFAILSTKVSSEVLCQYLSRAADSQRLSEDEFRFLRVTPPFEGVVSWIAQKLPAIDRIFLLSGYLPTLNARIKARGNKTMSFILGKKLKMTQIWKDGKVVPVTVIHATPNKVSILRTKEQDGYEAVQVALGGGKSGGKVGADNFGRVRKEFRNRPANPVDVSKFKVGAAVTVDGFKEGDKVRVSGIMKGRGFAGVVKRHNFGGGPKTHGQKNRHRAPGSIGSTAFQRVVPGRRMAGRMGGTLVTIKNLVVADIDPKKNLIMLRGAVPGARGGVIEIRK